MKQLTCLFLLSLVCSSALTQDIPSGFRPERYAPLWERNPFTLVTPVAPQTLRSPFDKLFLTSWLNNNGRAIIFVQNSETGGVERLTSEPNQNNLRLVEMHFDANPRLVEALVSNGKEQGVVKYNIAAAVPDLGQAGPVAAPMDGLSATAQTPPGLQAQRGLAPPAPPRPIEQIQRFIHTPPLRVYNGGG